MVNMQVSLVSFLSLFVGIIAIHEVSSLSSSSTKNENAPLLPTDPESMIRQAASAIVAAKRDPDNTSNKGLHRQTIRLALSESMYADKSESFVADRAIGWQGGPQETYRYIGPLVGQLLKEVANQDDAAVFSKSGLVPKVQTQVLLDFDGSALVNAQSPLGPKEDSLALVQPNTDKYYMDLIRRMEDEFSDTPGKDTKRLFLLVNPAWRKADSWGFWQSKQAQSQILDRYETTYALDQFIMRGNKMSLLKAWPHDWCVYWTPLSRPNLGNDETTPRLLGAFPERPEYNAIDKLLLETLR